MATLFPSTSASSNVVALSGPMVVSVFLDSALFGALTVQLYFYHRTFPDDKIPTKALIYTIYVLALFSAIVLMDSTFTTFGYGFTDISALTKISLDWIVTPIAGGLIALVSQIFYAYRMHILSGTHVLPILVGALALVSASGGLTVAVFLSQGGNVVVFRVPRARFNIATEVSFISLVCTDHIIRDLSLQIWYGASALCDLLIAACMTYYLLAKATTGIRSTQALISRLIRLIIETGSLTGKYQDFPILALASLFLCVAFPHQFYYVTPTSMVPYVYANTVLFVLNSRAGIGARGDLPASVVSNMQFAHTPRGLTDAEQPSVGFSDEGRVDDAIEMKDLPSAESTYAAGSHRGLILATHTLEFYPSF
ncbi:hypothetical protein FB45DRAFT_1054308 [Roridomyces roridus]|uniref:DUF6534 domain-containing protein n=1 Tax=Roridomyces roridus TaxID=1738132 RepID=A0AAD7FWQ6_9AGAR|nr:hypothetical protein FB45DRAFT_1054308 [Roridomyces roridus]